jgi:hypothetical protein
VDTGGAAALAVGTSGASSVSAQAAGGFGGNGGYGGWASSGGTFGSPGTAGAGGTTLAEAYLGTDLPKLATASASAGGVELSAQTFTTAEELMEFFFGQVLDLGTGWQSGDKLLAHFDLALGTDTRFAMSLGYLSVPEPGTGLLVVFGLLVLARTRRRTAFSA